MTTAKRLLAGLSAAILATSAHAGPVSPQASRTVLVIGGTTVTASTHAIVIPPKPSPSEQYAAAELRDWLTSATGESLPVVSGGAPAPRIPVVVGTGTLPARHAPALDVAALGSEGMAMHTDGPVLVLAGNRRGVLYAVYSFLEEFAGIRWLAPDCTVVPARGVVRIDDVDTSYTPRFASRALDYFSAFNQEWAARNKVNGYGYAKKSSIDEAHGGEWAYPDASYFWSTLRFFIPIDKYRTAHPEYFSEIDGKRVTTGELETDYCMTNPDVIRLTTEAVRGLLREHPESAMISVSQNDTGDCYCRCVNCARLAREHGAPSAMVVHLLNRVAQAIESEFPNVKLTTLSYLWSQRPPTGMTLHRNVIAEVCPIHLGQQTPIVNAGGEYVAQLKKDLAGWRALCAPGNVKFCQYSINYQHLYMPHPNLQVLQPNMKFFADNGAGHFYDCGSYSHRGSDLAELRAYLVAKLAWNPDSDAEQIIDEFVSGYYGAAAQPMREYIAALRSHMESRPPMHLSVYANPDDGQVSPQLLALGETKMLQALQLAAGDPVLLRRIEVAYLPIRYAQIMLAALDYTLADADTRLVSHLPEQVERHMKPFMDGLEKMGAKSVADVVVLPQEDWRRGILEQAANPALDIVTLDNGRLRLKIVPAKGGRIWRMTDVTAGCEMFGAWGVCKNPVEGRGYGEFLLPESMYRWKDEAAFSVTEQTSGSVTMRATLACGLICTRTVTLTGDSAGVTLRTAVANPTDKPVTISLCAHPVFRVPDAQPARVEMLDGNAVTQSETVNPQASEAQTQWFDHPTGEWRLVDPESGAVITNTFDKDKVARGLIWYDNRIRPHCANMELRYRQQILQPGDIAEFQHGYVVSNDRH